jgi:hypothetical protein
MMEKKVGRVARQKRREVTPCAGVGNAVRAV